MEKSPSHAYNGRMSKVRKGFTLLEAIVTIGILGVGFALTGVAVTQLIRVQDSAASVADHESVFHSADELMGRYFSFVALDTPLLTFERDSADPTSVVYVATEYETSARTVVVASASYTLQYSSETKLLTVETDVLSGTLEGYLNKTDWSSVKGISSLSFTVDDTIDFLTADVTLDDSVSRRFCYVLRT